MNQPDAEPKKTTVKWHYSYLRPVILLLVLFITVMFVCFVVYKNKFVPSNAYSLAAIPVIIVLAMAMYFFLKPYAVANMVSSISANPGKFALVISVMIAVFVLMYAYLASGNSTTHYWAGYALEIISLVAILMVGLSLFYRFFYTGLSGLRGWPAFVAGLIFYLPCLANDVVSWAAGEYARTPSSAFTLFGIELAMIGTYLWGPWLAHKVLGLTRANVITVYPDSAFLQSKTHISSYEEIRGKLGGATGGTNLMPDNAPLVYGLAFWVYLNHTQSSAADELPVFMYGSPTGMGDATKGPYSGHFVHPAITYLPDANRANKSSDPNSAVPSAKSGNVRVRFSNRPGNNPVTIDVPPQRWNLFAFNYNGGSADLFVNGELVSSVQFNGVPRVLTTDEMTAGGGKMQGAIRDVVYSELPLSKNSIVTMYNNRITADLMA